MNFNIISCLSQIPSTIYTMNRLSIILNTIYSWLSIIKEKILRFKNHSDAISTHKLHTIKMTIRKQKTLGRKKFLPSSLINNDLSIEWKRMKRDENIIITTLDQKTPGSSPGRTTRINKKPLWFMNCRGFIFWFRSYWISRKSWGDIKHKFFSPERAQDTSIGWSPMDSSPITLFFEYCGI